MPMGTKGRQTKRRIIACALHIFNEEGIEACSVKRICEEAEISVGAFYHHFITKEQLLREVIHQFEKDLLTALKKKRNAQPKERIQYILSFMLKRFSKLGVENSAWLLGHILSNRFNDIWQEKNSIYQMLRSEVSELHRQRQWVESVDATVSGLMQMTIGTVYAWCCRMGAFDLVRQGWSCAEMVLGTMVPAARSGEVHCVGTATAGTQ